MTLCLISTTGSCNVTLSRTSVLAIPLESAVAKNASANPLGCAVTKSLDLKPPEMNTYKKTGGSPLLFASAPLTFFLLPFRLPAYLSVACDLWYISGRKKKTSTRQAQRTQNTRRKRPHETQDLVDCSRLRSAGDCGQRLE